MRVKGGRGSTCHACGLRVSFYFGFPFFLLGYKENGLRNLDRVRVNLAQCFISGICFIFFPQFSRIIQYL